MRRYLGPLLLLCVLAACRPEPKPTPAPPQTEAAALSTTPATATLTPPDPGQAVVLLEEWGVSNPDSAALLLDSAYRLAPAQLMALIPRAPLPVLTRWLDQREFRFRFEGHWNYRLNRLADLDAASFLALRRQLLADPANAKDPDLALFLHMAGASLADTTQRHVYIRQALLANPAAAADFTTKTAAQLNRTGGNLREGAIALTAVLYLAPDAVHQRFWQQSGWLERPKVDELALLPHQALLLLDDRLPRLAFPAAQLERLHQALVQAQAQSRT